MNERLIDEAYNARQAARGENALRLEAERERDDLRAEVERWVKEVAHLKLAAEKAERERDEVRLAKDIAYSERDRLVAALSALYPSHMQRHPSEDKEWEDDWRWIVVVQLPTGQATWHIHDSEKPWFNHLVAHDLFTTWDGHTTDEKYERLDAAREGEEIDGLRAELVTGDARFIVVEEALTKAERERDEAREDLFKALHFASSIRTCFREQDSQTVLYVSRRICDGAFALGDKYDEAIDAAREGR